MLKQSLNAFKLIQHRFSFDSRSFNTVNFKGVENGFDIALQQNRMNVEANVGAVCSSLYSKAKAKRLGLKIWGEKEKKSETSAVNQNPYVSQKQNNAKEVKNQTNKLKTSATFL